MKEVLEDCKRAKTNTFVSHISPDGRQEEVSVHLKEVAVMAAKFAKTFGGEEFAFLAGLVHDIGKFSDEFQKRILCGGCKVDHATAGSYELYERGLPTNLLSYCVAGHHGGLPDGGNICVDSVDDKTLAGRLKRAKEARIPSYDKWINEINLPSEVTYIPASNECADDGFACSFLVRMLYSCLVDADFLCTERFMDGKGRQTSYGSIEEILKLVEKRIRTFYPPEGALNTIRCELLEDCLNAAGKERGFFTLTAPTGSGKTISSLSFGLRHAHINGLDRVIYAIPYTTIIEQNANVFKEIIGEDNIIEAHSGLILDENNEDDERINRLRLAAENWDAPIVVTTNVQFFESFYSSKPSKNRKLHNIANSVIILDEAQSLPYSQLLPCVRVLCELVLRYGCSVVFCTATQPLLNKYLERYCCRAIEIVSDCTLLAEKLKRVSYEYVGSLTDKELSCRLVEHDQVLCVVNSRKQARIVFDLIAGMKNRSEIFHLSTLMHPAHREEILLTVRQRLKNNLPCIVVSTSLIEAGVDIDFPVVYRAVAGADSIVQAAGRCNRNGKNLSKGITYVFDTISEDGDICPYSLPYEVEKRAQITKELIREQKKSFRDQKKNNEAISCYMESSDFIKDYFEYRNTSEMGCMDKSGALKAMSDLVGTDKFLSYPFRTVSENFSLIENASCSVVYPDDHIVDILNRLEYGEVYRGDISKLMRYSVGIYDGDLTRLRGIGAIRLVAAGIYVLINLELYDDYIGLMMGDVGGRAVMY